jgi:hypothetical protein
MKLWILALVLFFFAVGLRMWNLNMVGRSSDETALVDKGYVIMEMVRKGDFSNPYWYTKANGHPLLTTYGYGLASYGDFVRYDENKTTDIYFSSSKGGPIFRYDLTNTRLVSVLISALSVVLVFFIGARYFSLFVGITAGVIVAMLPHYLGYSQLVTYDSWVLPFFTACAFSYFLYLEKRSLKYLILTGILTGLTLQVKESTGIIVALYIGTYLIWRRLTGGKGTSFYHLVAICAIGFITYVALWPMPWIHIIDYLKFEQALWFSDFGLTPDLSFGRVGGAHFYYYVIAFLVTTPVLILLLTGAGINAVIKKRKQWIYAALLFWFLVPFSMSVFHHRQNFVRYIIEIYAPTALLAALGLEYCVRFLTKKSYAKYVGMLVVFSYLMWILMMMTPYYLAYYNELVGGTANVYQRRLFYIGWFGEGLRAPSMFIASNAKKNMRVGFATEPSSYNAIYMIPTLNYEPFVANRRYDYLLVSYYDALRSGIDEKSLSHDYTLVYRETVAGADIAHVYKHK